MVETSEVHRPSANRAQLPLPAAAAVSCCAIVTAGVRSARALHAAFERDPIQLGRRRRQLTSRQDCWFTDPTTVLWVPPVFPGSSARLPAGAIADNANAVQQR